MSELDDSKEKNGLKEASLAQNTDVSQANVSNNSKPRRRVKAPGQAHKKRLSLPNVEERFYSYQKSSECKLAERQRAKEEEDMKDCTFQPQIIGSGHRKNRSYSKFFQDMNKFVKAKEDKLSALRTCQESRAEVFNFQPKISDKSSRISKTSSYCALPTHERLFFASKGHHKSKSYLSRDSDSSQQAEEFTPSINQKSRHMVNRGSEHLYQDAVRRMKKETPSVELHISGASKNSQRILSNKFLTSFADMSKSIDTQGENEINYIRFLEMLRSMGFISKHRSELESQKILELWKILKNQRDLVGLEDLKVAMMGIMGYYQPWMNKGNFKLNKTSAKKFHEQFTALFESRGLYSNRMPTEKKEVKKKVYRPRIISSNLKALLNVRSKEEIEIEGFPSADDSIRANDMNRKLTHTPMSPQVKVDLKRINSTMVITEDFNDKIDTNNSDFPFKRRKELYTVKIFSHPEPFDLDDPSPVKRFAHRIAFRKQITLSNLIDNPNKTDN